ncbi:MAG: DUF4910 domain-containing protein [bacterium]
MFKQITDLLTSEVSPQRVFDHVLGVSQFHRIQASPGYRRSAEYCIDRMLEHSPAARVIHYPADSGVKFWHFPSFEEWSAKRAVLKITSPPQLASKLADFSDCPISLIQRSRSTASEGITTEIVSAGMGRVEKDYKRAKGKIVLCDAVRASHVYDAAVSSGAIGIILYKQRPLPGVREGSGVYGVRQYNSFWWDENELFGFVLKPEDGERLASYLHSPASKDKPVKAWAVVESESYPGTLEVVTSLIPGTEEGEIGIIAHLCHPKPSAGDNASGVAVLLEVHAVLSRLIEQGILEKPRFGIRFLLVPEITGTFAYLSREHQLRHRLMTAINLDMVGQRQEVTGSTLCIESAPMASPCFIQFLLEYLLRQSFRLGMDKGPFQDLLSIRLQQTPFSGGSDHYVLSDPMVGIPTPMLIQWPDRYYHTSGDTADKISPETLKSVAVAVAACAYLCASGDEDALLRIADIVGAGLRKSAIEKIYGFSTSEAPLWIGLEYQAGVILEHGKQTLASIARLARRSRRLASRLNIHTRAFMRCVKEEASALTVKTSFSRSQRSHAREQMREHANRIVQRLLPGPIPAQMLIHRVGRRRRAEYYRWQKVEPLADLMEILALYRADGERSVTEISRLVAAEIGQSNPDFIRFCFELLAELELAKITR